MTDPENTNPPAHYLSERPLTEVIKAWLRRRPVLRRLKNRYDLLRLEPAIRRDDRLRLKWRLTSRAPSKIYDAGGAQIGSRLYVIGGYTSLNEVSERILVFDMKRRRWDRPIAAPEDMAHSHLGACVEKERYIYIVSGQKGPQCAPAVRDGFVLDTESGGWSPLPHLPAARYAPIAEITEGRLHIAGGSGEDRVTPAKEHWSIAVQDGQALETAWREEPPIPRGGPHRGSIAIDGQIYVFGGQEGDFRAIEGDPNFTCTHKTRELYHPECYRYDPAQRSWRRLADMPVTASHTDYAVVRRRDQILVIGGQVHKTADDFQLTLTDCIQAYDLKTDTWSDFGRLPYRLKTAVCGIWEDALFVTTGQRDRSGTNPSPGAVVDHCWRVSLDP